MPETGAGFFFQLKRWPIWSHSIKRGIWFFGTVLLVLADGHAGWTQAPPDQFRFRHITVNEGLSHSDAMCVAQDRLGFVWIGTNKGINRYDGYSLRPYNLPASQAGLTSNRVRALHVDRAGDLWAGAEGGGLFRYDRRTERFRNVQTLSVDSAWAPVLRQLLRSSVLAIASDSQNRLWVATQERGVFVLHVSAEGHLDSVGQVQLIDKPAETPSFYKLVVDRQDNVWLGTLGSGLWRVAQRRPDPHKRPPLASRVASLAAYNIRALHLDDQGCLWVGTDYQVLWLNQPAPGADSVQAFVPIRRTFAHVESLFRDSSKRLWIGTNFGLLLMQPGTATAQTPPIDEQQVRTFLPLDTDPTSISSPRIHDILEDRFHNLWLAASAGGLNQLNLRAKPFVLLRRQIGGQTSPADNYINAIHQGPNSHLLWMGTRNGFASYDLVRKSYQNYLSRSLSGSVNGIDVSTLMQASDGRLWVGTRYSGLYVLDERNPASLRQLTRAGYDSGLTGLSIESIAEDRDGTIWVGTLNAGMYVFDRQGNLLRTISRLSAAVPFPQVAALLYDPDQHVLWISSRDAGLFKCGIDQQALRLLTQYRNEPNNPNSLLTNYTWPLQKDRRGNLWIGTIGGGLHRLTRLPNGQERIERYGQWVPETDVESLLTDQAGNLWIGGTGLYQFNPVTKRLLHYDVSDGLQSNSFKVGAAYRGSDGTLYFGGINGINYFQPSAIRPNPFPPLVQLTGLRVLNQPVMAGDTLNGRVLLTAPLSEPQTVELKASENDFSIEFVGLNYANPHKQQYAYRMVGFNDEWVTTSADRRVANFTNLPPGSYTFLVRASNDDGVWADRAASIQFTILPPWWKTWWAYLAYIAVIGGGLMFYRRSEMNQQALKNKLKLEQFKVEKEKEVSDLKVRFFTQVSHELRTPLTLILGPVEELSNATGPIQQAKDKILLVHQQTHKLLNLVNQLLDFRKVESGNVSLRASRANVIPFLTEIALIFKLKAEELQLDYTIALPSQPVPLYFDRSKLEIVLTNLLSNAFKYTPAGEKIRVEASVKGTPAEAAVFSGKKLTDNYLQVVVRDWGVGMKPEEIERIFDPYYQASHTETMQIMGTGIGLSIVNEFVRAHAGEIDVQSEPGAGTVFTLRLPFGRAHLDDGSMLEEPVQPENAPEPAGETDLQEAQPPADLVPLLPGSARVLVVEDNDELRQYIQQLLSPTFEVILAKDGAEGWEKTLDQAPDLIVSDVMMPRRSGLELCKQIKQHPRTSHIPVVLLTARTAAAHELEGLETGADEYMLKPFNPRLLQTKVTVMLQSRLRLREYYQRQILLQPTDLVIPVKEKRLLENVMQLIEANLTNPDFSIPMLVREMGMSQSVLYRQIKAMTGQSVVELIRDVRLKRAAQLLASSDLKIVDVASRVGFEDIKYFRKSFHALYSMTPSEYVKQHRAAAAGQSVE